MVSVVAVILVLFSTFIGAIGVLILKKGTNKYSFFELLRTRYLWWGVVLFVVASLLYVGALWREELSVIYPLASLAYVWTTLFSVKYLGEKMNSFKWLGLLGIILGVVLIGLGSA